MPDLIKPVVRSNFLRFNTQFEGILSHMYLDILGLVTVGVGNLIDPVGLAANLPFLHADGSPASMDEIMGEWALVKRHTELAHEGAGAARAYCTLHLDEAGITNLVDDKLTAMATALAKRFPLADWPADAQLGLCSMAWAMGPGFQFPKFQAAAVRGDFLEASTECDINAAHNPGVVPRNAANRMLFQNAAKVVSQGLDGDALHLTPITDASEGTPETQTTTDVDPV
jgi:hypothetical protein